MMTKKDLLELKKRYKKSGCTFTKLCGCYVNNEKEIVLNIEETFLNLEEDEFFKYLEIAKKTLSGTIGNNLLELEFPLEEEQPGGKQQFLMALRQSKLKNEELLSRFYELIIDTYDHAGNYLILLFHDAYDVITKTSDNAKLDESEEVFEYVLCAICPVALTKPALGYLEEENRIGPRTRDWVVCPPESGFLFPAFTDRSTDIHSVVVYHKDAKEPHRELMEDILSCPSKATATEQKKTFEAILNNFIQDDHVKEQTIMTIQEGLSEIIEEQEELVTNENDPVLLTTDSMKTILTEIKLPEEVTEKIESAYKNHFEEMPPAVEHLIDNKILALSETKRTEQALARQVKQLQEQLEEQTSSLSLLDDCDIVLNVKPEKVTQITTELRNGQKCLVIPMEENEHATINGEMDPLL